jgi:N-acetylglucosaminyldiphosphoundecaprenol N-acetyl-beta-D-mannosaminyltransferase
MRRAVTENWRIYLLGAREAVVSEVARIYTDKYPGVQIVGYRNGYWSNEEEASVVDAIATARPDILFVAISSPKKEQFLNRHQHRMRVPFAMGVGGTFDVAVGKVSRAPLWMRNAGLEWLHRFLQEPRRMFKRYFVDDTWFFWMVIREIATRHKSRQPAQDGNH